MLVISRNLVAHLVLSTDKEANGVGSLGVVDVPTLVCKVDLFSSAVFAYPSVLPIRNDLVTFYTQDYNVTYPASVSAI